MDNRDGENELILRNEKENDKGSDEDKDEPKATKAKLSKKPKKSLIQALRSRFTKK